MCSLVLKQLYKFIFYETQYMLAIKYYLEIPYIINKMFFGSDKFKKMQGSHESVWSKFERITLYKDCLLYQNQNDKVYTSKCKSFIVYKLDRSNLYTQQGTPNKRMRAILKEMSILKKIRCENVARISQYSENQETGYNYIVVEGCSSLRQYLEQNPKLNQRKALMFIQQLLQALIHISEKNIQHKSIRPQNIIVTKDRKIRLANFTGHKFIYKLSQGLQSKQFQINKKSRYSQSYRCPLQINKTKSDVRNKIWSLGFILYELLIGECPWKGSFQETIYKNMQNQKLQLDKVDISSKTKELIRLMLSQNNNQISYDNILEYIRMKPAHMIYYDRMPSRPNYQYQRDVYQQWNKAKNDYDKKQTQTSLKSNSQSDVHLGFEAEKPFYSLTSIPAQEKIQKTSLPRSDSDLYKVQYLKVQNKSGLNKYDEPARKIDTTSVDSKQKQNYEYDNENEQSGKFQIRIRTPKNQSRPSSSRSISNKPPVPPSHPKSANYISNSYQSSAQIPNIPLPPKMKVQPKVSQNNYKSIQQYSAGININTQYNPSYRFDSQTTPSSQTLTSTSAYIPTSTPTTTTMSYNPSTNHNTTSVYNSTAQNPPSESAYPSSSLYSSSPHFQYKPQYQSPYQFPSSRYDFKPQTPSSYPSISPSPSQSTPSLLLNKYSNNYTSSPSPLPSPSTSYTPLSPSNIDFKHRYQPYYRQFQRKQQPIRKQGQQQKFTRYQTQKKSSQYQLEYEQKQSDYPFKNDQPSLFSYQYKYKYEEPQFKQNLNNNTEKRPQTPIQQPKLLHQKSQPQLLNLNARPQSQSQPKKQPYQPFQTYQPYNDPFNIQNRSRFPFPPSSNLDFFTTGKTPSMQKFCRVDRMDRFGTFDSRYQTTTNSLSKNKNEFSNQKYDKFSKYVPETGSKPSFQQSYQSYINKWNGRSQSYEKRAGYLYK